MIDPVAEAGGCGVTVKVNVVRPVLVIPGAAIVPLYSESDAPEIVMLSPVLKPCATLVVTVTVPLPVGRVIELIVRDTPAAAVIAPAAGDVGVSSVGASSNVRSLLLILVHGVLFATL